MTTPSPMTAPTCKTCPAWYDWFYPSSERPPWPRERPWMDFPPGCALLLGCLALAVAALLYDLLA